MGLFQPVAEAHQGDLRGGVGHQAIAAGFIAGEFLTVEEQYIETSFRGVVRRSGTGGTRADDYEIVTFAHGGASSAR